MGRTRRSAPRRPCRIVAVSSGLVGLVGVILCWSAFVGSPAARIARQAHADHLRAVASAVAPLAPAAFPAPAPAGPAPALSGVAAPWHPTVPGQVATVTIPALEVTAPVIAEGVSGGSLDIPADVHHVGWDDQTPPPGHPGVTLLAGHVNWVGQGEGALGQLGQLVPGDQVVVDWQGTQTTWTVDARPRLSPNAVAHRSLFTNTGTPRLVLVTCGGPFRETAAGGSYADNVIVTAAPAG